MRPSFRVECKLHDVEPSQLEQRELEPSPEDFMMTPSGPLGSKILVGQVEGPFHGEFDTREKAEAYIKQWMETNKYWPSVFFISDHGNIFPACLDESPFECEAKDRRSDSK